MANPQVKNGYVRIATELYDALADYYRNNKSITSSEKDMIFKIMRDTYGFNCNKHLMTESYLAKALGISLNWIKKTKSRLRKRNMIFIEKDAKGRCIIGIQEDYDKWVQDGNGRYAISQTHVSVDRCHSSYNDGITTDTNPTGNCSYQQYNTEEYNTKEKKTVPSEHLELIEKVKSRFSNVYRESDNIWIIQMTYDENTVARLSQGEVDEEWYTDMREVCEYKSFGR